MKNSVFIFFIVLLMSSCQKMNDNIQEYLDRGEIDYIGTPVWATALGGNNRILLLWMVNTDPRIEQCTIYWNNGLDSTTCQVTPKPLSEIEGLPDGLVIPEEVDTLGAKYMTAMLDNMPENVYIFDIFHTGSLGHRSVRYELTGQSYGESYRQTLMNRILKSAVYKMDDGTLNVLWSPAEINEVGIQVEYYDVSDANPKTIMISANDTIATIPGFDKTKPVYYSTIYKPVMAIDSFQTDQSEIAYSVISRTPVNMTYLLQNPGPGFTLGDAIVPVDDPPSTDRWFTPAGWTTNDAAKTNAIIDTHPSWGDGHVIGISTDWGLPINEVFNGKLYQTIDLDAGDYRFDAYLMDTYDYDQSWSTDEVGFMYMVANIGSDIPDQENKDSALSYFLVPVKTDDISQLSLNFTLSERSTVSIGFVGGSFWSRVLFSRVELWGL